VSPVDRSVAGLSATADELEIGEGEEREHLRAVLGDAAIPYLLQPD
jgi:hypothetical protein